MLGTAYHLKNHHQENLTEKIICYGVSENDMQNVILAIYYDLKEASSYDSNLIDQK